MSEVVKDRLYPPTKYRKFKPIPFLGEPNAKDEWYSRDTWNPVNTFIHTESYDILKADDSIFLFGRRGTGKTALLHMLQYDVKNGNVNNYSYVKIVEEESLYHDFALMLRGSSLGQLPKYDLVHMMRNKWIWALKVSAMIAVLEGNSDAENAKENKIDPKDLKIIEDYLAGQGLTRKNASAVKRFVDAFVDELEKVDYTPLNIATGVARVTRRLITPEYELAEDALTNILSRNSKCYILIDSIKYFNFKDDVYSAIASGLISAALDLYTKRECFHILAKVAFPSELYPFLDPENREHMDGRNLFILWKFHDLVNLIAKRFWYIKYKDSFPDTYNQFDDYELSLNFVNSILPKSVISENGFEFDTFPYIVRHTQRKPRQLISILNLIITLHGIKNKTEFSMFKGKLNPNVIVEGTHAALDGLVTGCFHTYNQIVEDAEELCKRILSNMPISFSYSELDSHIKEASALRDKRGLTNHDLRKLLINSGAIGIKTDEADYKKASDKKILYVQFEYQVKNTVPFSSTSEFVMHPMFIQELGAKIDMSNNNQFIYPEPADDSEKDIIKAMGIRIS
jgi:hypothetical protein